MNVLSKRQAHRALEDNKEASGPTMRKLGRYNTLSNIPFKGINWGTLIFIQIMLLTQMLWLKTSAASLFATVHGEHSAQPIDTAEIFIELKLL